MADAVVRTRPANRAVAAVFLLLGLVLVLVALLAAALIWQGHRDARQALEARAVSSAYVASTHVRWLVEANLQALRRVADTMRWSAAPIQESREELEAVAAALPGAVRIGVFDGQGRLVYAMDAANMPQDISGEEFFTTLDPDSRWVIGPLTLDPDGGQAWFPISYRIGRDGVFLGAAVTFVPASLMAQFWRSMDLGPGSSVGLLRNDGWLVARYPIPEMQLNLADYVLFTDHLPESPEGLYEAEASPADGIARVVAYRTVEGLPLIVAVGVPATELAASFWQGMGEFLLVAIPVVLGLVLVSLWLVALLRKVERAHRALTEAHARNQMLLREIHHRVKNNLQTVSALVRLQPGPREAKEELMRRIQAMSMVHEHIYSADRFDRIDLAEYIRTLVAGLLGSHAEGVSIDCRLESVAVPVERAQPLGLILNEVISNAMKHAFPDGRNGTITITLATSPSGRVLLEVRDDGAGYDPEALPGRGIGLQLVQGLTQQVGGTYTVASDGGTTVRLDFPIVESPEAETPAAKAAE